MHGRELAGGTVVQYGSVPARGTAARQVDVWLPPGYAEAEVRYPVIYMHDGQNLFSPSLAYGGEDWGVAPAAVRVCAELGLPGVIIVGVWNSPTRWVDYMPQRPLERPGAEQVRERFVKQAGAVPYSDGYVAFLADELKPQIDSAYRTLPGREHTCVMGSSMGGLISLYALCQRPAVYGGAGCLSTHWLAGEEPLVDGLAAELPLPGVHRLYFDFGTVGLDEGYEPFQRRMDAHLRAAGYVEGADWMTRKFVGADHNEAAWRARVHLPLAFLLGRVTPP